MQSIYLYVALAIIAVLIVVSGAYYVSSITQSTQSNASNIKQATIQLTDPANVPAETSSLIINYSNVYVNVVTNGSSRWVNQSIGGSIELLGLANKSVLLAIVNISSTSTIDKVGFNVSSALIIVNGSVYKVIVPNDRFLANVSGTSKINGSVNVIMALSPTIVTIETANAPLFVLLPSLKAVLEHINNSNSTANVIGREMPISENEQELLSHSSPNISILSASLSTSGNTTNLNVIVKDNSNKSVILKGLSLFGQISTVLNRSAIHEIANYTVQSDGPGGSIGIQLPSARGAPGNYSFNNITSQINETAVTEKINATDSSIFRNETENAAAVSYMRDINFLISSTGKLFIPFDRPEAVLHPINKSMPIQSLLPICRNFPTAPSNRTESELQTSISSCLGNGFVINSSSSVTLTFSGVISMGFGSLVIKLVSGQNYNLMLTGELSSSANYNVTAS